MTITNEIIKSIHIARAANTGLDSFYLHESEVRELYIESNDRHGDLGCREFGFSGKLTKGITFKGVPLKYCEVLHND